MNISGLGALGLAAAVLSAGGTLTRAPDEEHDGYVPPTITPELAAILADAKARQLERAEKEAHLRYGATDVEAISSAELKRRRKAEKRAKHAKANP